MANVLIYKCKGCTRYIAVDEIVDDYTSPSCDCRSGKDVVLTACVDGAVVLARLANEYSSSGLAALRGEYGK